MRLVTPASRRRSPAVALPLCLAAGVAVSAASGPAPSPGVLTGAAAGDARPSPPLVMLRLSTTMQLPEESRATMRGEIEGIWRREGLDVQWLAMSPGAPLPPAAIRVVVVDRARDPVPTDHEWPVAQLLFDDLNRPVAVSSLAAAERVLEAGTDRVEPSRLRQRRLGLVLGRAMAHEIGHYLLNTASHARRGLMRARIDARDLADLRAGGFFLDAPAARWLRDAMVPRMAAGTGLARFDYSR